MVNAVNNIVQEQVLGIVLGTTVYKVQLPQLEEYPLIYEQPIKYTPFQLLWRTMDLTKCLSNINVQHCI